MARPKIPEHLHHHNPVVVYLRDDDAQLLRQIASRRGIQAGVLARALLKAKLDAIAGSVAGQATTIPGITQDS